MERKRDFPSLKDWRVSEMLHAPTAPINYNLGEELSRLAEIAPTSAVMEAFKRIELRLREMLDTPGTLPLRPMGGRVLARGARERGLISDETLAAIEGLSVLRNLVAHSDSDIGVDRARDYLALADAVLYALRSRESVLRVGPRPRRLSRPVRRARRRMGIPLERRTHGRWAHHCPWNGRHRSG